MKNDFVSTAIAEASRAEGDRCGALGRILPALEAIGEYVSNYAASRDALIEAAKRAYRACPGDAAPRADLLANWMSEIAEGRAERELVRAALADAGFSAFGFNCDESAARRREIDKDTGTLIYELAGRNRRFLDEIAQAADAAAKA